jgi:hypothetical protein
MPGPAGGPPPAAKSLGIAGFYFPVLTAMLGVGHGYLLTLLKTSVIGFPA